MINKRHGYTLAEIMVVLLVLTIIFAAFAPIITKRRQTTTSSKYNVWEYYDRITYDAFYNPGNADVNGEAFIGATPENKDAITTTFAPLSKLVIRASKEVGSEAANQRHIQFRYARSSTSDKGTFAGTWYMDGKNALMGGTYHQIDSKSTTNPARNNTAIGYDALSAVKSSENNTAIGYRALPALSGSTSKSNTAIGYEAGLITTSAGNTLIGYKAGSTSNGRQNTYIGYNVLGGTGGSNNTYLGAYAGPTAGTTSENTAIGYNALSSITSGTHNIALGVNALKNLENGDNNTAIGYNACSEITKSSNKTCIGVNSGPHSGTASETYIEALSDSDTEPRTYIGSKPKGYTGDAVLEIHNMKTKDSSTIGVSNIYGTTGLYYMEIATQSDATTVINGNLIVNGRPYFTSAGRLHHFHDENSISTNRYFGRGQNSQYYAQCATNANTYFMSSYQLCPKLYPTKLSDRRLKNIGDKFTAGMKELRELKVYNYTFKNDANKTPQIGVIAQELQKVFPNSVYKGEDGYLRIRWDEMFYAAINAVKELDNRIASLVKRVTNVDAQITQLEQENVSLKTQVAALTTRVNKLKNQ